MDYDPRALPPGIPSTFRGNSLCHIWTYQTVDGSDLGHVARYDDGNGYKDIVPCFRQGSKGWEMGAPAAPRPLFGLKSLSVPPTTTVYIVEGEKCAAAIHSIGLPAVSSLGGANAPQKADWAPLEPFRRIVLLPDNDKPGEGYIRVVAGILSRLPGAREVLVCRLPGLGEGEDVVEWLASRLTEAWDGFRPVPREPGDGLVEEFLEVVDANSTPLPTEWTDASSGCAMPIPLRPPRSPAESFPIAALGRILGDAAREMHRVIRAPEAMCGQSVLAAATLAVQHIADVEIDGRGSPLSEFFVTVGESGERKSAVDSVALSPHRTFQRDLATRHKEEHRAYTDARDVFDKARCAILNKGKNRQGREEELRDLGPPPEPPLIPAIITDDLTLEGVQKQLAHGWPSIGIYADEGGKVTGGHAMSEDNVLKTISGLSGFWDGKETLRLRAGDDLSILFGRRVSLHLMLQPRVAAMVFGNGLLQDQGFLSRCLPAWPDSTAGTRLYQESNIYESLSVTAYCDRLLEMIREPLPLAGESRNELAPRCLRLNPKAKRAWVAFHDRVELQLDKEGRYASIRGFANKAAEHAARLAGVLALVRSASALEIDVDTMEAGIKLAEYYLNEWLRIREEGAVDPDIELAEKLLAWLRKQDGAVNLRAILQYGPNPLRKKEAAEKALKRLVMHGYAEELPQMQGDSRTQAGRKWRVLPVNED